MPQNKLGMILMAVAAVGTSAGCDGTAGLDEAGSTTQQAAALTGENGLAWNGMSYNGLAYNGLSFNGMSYNGLSYNGLSYNGLPYNGLSYNGLSSPYTWNATEPGSLVSSSRPIFALNRSQPLPR